MKRFWLLAVLMGIFLLVGCSAAPQMETQPTEPEIYTYEEAISNAIEVSKKLI